jgi:glycosyltransferase involved in cell wall biosynthesis
MCGCTPVSTDCPTGPREVLGDEVYGYLAPVANPRALAASIEQALRCPIPTKKLRKAVLPFSESSVIARHFNVLGIKKD